MRKSLADRLDAKTRKDENGCHVWRGASTGNGYGYIYANGCGQRAHRVAYKLFCGAIPDGMCVLHKCDNRRCINPDHLFLGSYRDNHDDMDRKRRRAVGSSLPQTKLEKEHVLAIRASQDHPSVLAKRYGISRFNIYHIRKRETWKHL